MKLKRLALCAASVLLAGCDGSHTKRSPEFPAPVALTQERLYDVAQRCLQFHAEYAQWPVDINMLSAGVPGATSNLCDGWGVPFVLISLPSSPQKLWIRSYGGDGKPGGTEASADLGLQIDSTVVRIIKL
jgi:hypothetical protein